jgi:phage terminase small subunit
MGTEIARLEDEGDIGPAMEAISPKQRKFVRAMLQLGSSNYTEAARLAGYSTKSESSIRVQGHILAHDSRVLAAIQEEARKRLGAGLIMASSILIGIAEGKYEAKASDRLKAIDMIMSRQGMPAVTQHLVTDGRAQSDTDLMADLDKKMRAVGMKLSEIMGGPKVINAEYTVVTGAEGLEDLL